MEHILGDYLTQYHPTYLTAISVGLNGCVKIVDGNGMKRIEFFFNQILVPTFVRKAYNAISVSCVTGRSKLIGSVPFRIEFSTFFIFMKDYFELEMRQ